MLHAPDGGEVEDFDILNDLQTSIEVNLGHGWQVLYPMTRLCLKDAVSVAVRLRDDPEISGSCIVGASLLASTSFGHFGIKALQFLEAEIQEVKEEKRLAEERKWRATEALEGKK